MLLDFSDAVSVNVFTLGATFLKLQQRIGIRIPIVGAYGMVWYGMVWYCMVWHGMVWYGMVMISHSNI